MSNEQKSLPLPAGPSEKMTTDQARDFLVKWMRANFQTDRTFTDYIMSRLAGDFAWQLATALAAAPAIPPPAPAQVGSIGDDPEFRRLRWAVAQDWTRSGLHAEFITCIEAWADSRPQAAPVAAPAGVAPAMLQGLDETLLKLARRTLWIAYVWNDHNFGPAHIEARNTCKALGIMTFDQANEWLAAPDVAPSAAAPVVLTDEQVLKGARFLSDYSADQCNVDREDSWDTYGKNFIAEFRAAVESALTGQQATKGTEP